jgi:hypothetical protein
MSHRRRVCLQGFQFCKGRGGGGSRTGGGTVTGRGWEATQLDAREVTSGA